MIGLILTGTAGAQAQRLVSLLSESQIQIDSSFAGEKLTLFGNIEPDQGTEEAVSGAFNVIIVVRGPSVNGVTRRKNWTYGLWINTEQVQFERIPSFYHVLSSAPLDEIASPEVLADEVILPQARAAQAAIEGSSDEAQFGNEFIRILSERGLYAVDERAVQFRSDTLYFAQLDLPASVPDGNFLAETYLLEDGKVIAHQAGAFRIRKIGFERFLTLSAMQYPLLYGLACVLLAVGTGWLGGVAFRR